MCELCQDPWEPFFAGKFIELANSFELHSFLCKCPQCGTLYDVYPEGRAAPKKITEAEARERFPGALLWTGPACASHSTKAASAGMSAHSPPKMKPAATSSNS